MCQNLLRARAFRNGAAIPSTMTALNYLFGIRPAPGFSQNVFETVARAIPANFYPDVLWDGMDVDLLGRIAKRAAATLKEEINFDIEVSTPFSRRLFRTRNDYLDTLEKELQRGFSVLIVFVDWPKRDGGGSHWTVVREIHRDHLTLVDSGRHRWPSHDSVLAKVRVPASIRNIRLC